MISFRLSVIALSATLIFSVGSSASTATTNYSHPEFSVAYGSTLNLRETGSQIVIETMENALRQGGLALLGEGFQLDSSLSYHSGDNEGIEGDLDVVVPLWNGGRHAIFTQPGFVFWKGLEGEERFDGNIGLVYRAELTRGLIAGASIFYDQDFEIGHSRVSGGLDLQSGFFRFGANYYHPLSEIEDGREGFVEEALSGMDARLVFEREAVRLGSTIGYWDYKGEESGGQEDSRSGWKTSIGLDFGVRILPGVFAEASWERHKDNIVLDERIFAGLAFRFSLPDFQGASYGSGEMTSNLYKIVDREKRILYEEREADGILLTLGEGVIEEGGTVNVAVQLREASTEDVVINLVGSGTATYGEISDDGDWLLNNGSGNCSAVTGTSCQITITAGETVPSNNAVITINNDGGGEDPETIVLSTTIASGDASLTSRPLVITIPADPPLPRVSIVRATGSGSVAEGDTVELGIQLSETVREDVTINLVGSGSTATYGSSNDWTLSVGGTACTEVTEDNCQVTIDADDTSATVEITVNDDGRTGETPEDIVLSITVDSGSMHLVSAGSPFTLNISADASLPAVSLSAGSASIREGNTETITLTLNASVGSPTTFNLIGGGTDATYGASNDWNLSVGGIDCAMATRSNPCQVTIGANSTTAEVSVEVNADGTNETTPQNFTVEVEVDSGSTNLVMPGSSSSLSFTIPADLPTVSLNYGGDGGIADLETQRMTIELSEALTSAVEIYIVGDGSATLGTGSDWSFVYEVLDANTMPPATFGDGTRTGDDCASLAVGSCSVEITAGKTIVDIAFTALGGSGETIVLAIAIPTSAQSLVQLGSPSRHEVTID